MNKGDFSSSIDFELAKRDMQYQDLDPIDPKIATLCLRDQVQANGENNSSTIGNCDLADECTFANSKLGGVSGFVLKPQ